LRGVPRRHDAVLLLYLHELAQERRNLICFGIKREDGQPIYRSGAIIGRMVHAITSSMRAISILPGRHAPRWPAPACNRASVSISMGDFMRASSWPMSTAGAPPMSSLMTSRRFVPSPRRRAASVLPTGKIAQLAAAVGYDAWKPAVDLGVKDACRCGIRT
jgi:hypothetical protein